MKRKFIIPILAAIVGLVVVMSVSAFKKENKAKGYQTFRYFSYPNTTYTEEAFEMFGNWTYLGTSNPGSNPCADGTTHSCVVKVADNLLPAESEELDTYPKRFAAYLSSIGSAANYVTSSSNYTYRKP